MIQVGEVLDKYELLERVGQGGMAIVYRGLDRSLKRVVAVKILHGHLSDYQEARDRFEREAQAVAKLRHENILEIFDFAAKEGGASYIVTEFIEGQTLKQLITDRPIAFPEIGAMLMLQVCRALAHAHAHKILHRDIKPENIMIRSDGVVKLMDFGISHMVDLERLTVTGQLLGSPAYMAPEHVEGRPLDYRTDVFAVGIVLYQLCTGKLPFEGKNPHEVLKRIAECKFVDPRQVNPRLGNRLGRIILRAMAARPDDRFPTIGEMVIAIEGYLEESGLPIDKVSGELGRYFKSPASYEQALSTTLIDHLTRRGQKLLADDEQSAALDVFDRVLTIEPQNAKVLAILDNINRRRALRKVGLGALGVAVIAGSAFALHVKMQPPPAGPPPTLDPIGTNVVSPDPNRIVQPDPAPPIAVDAGLIAPPADTVVAVAVPHDGGRVVTPPPPEDGPPVVRSVAELKVFPDKGAQYKIGAGPWVAIVDGAASVPFDGASTEVTVGNRTGCCEEQSVRLEAGKNAGLIALPFLPGTLTPTCDDPTVSFVQVNNKTSSPGQKVSIQFDKTTDTERNVTVKFIGGRGGGKEVKVVVKPGQDAGVVKCDP